MTLRERLKTGDLVKIGFKSPKDEKADGSKFIFCGMINGAAFEYIENASRREYDRLRLERIRAAQMASKARSVGAWERKARKYGELLDNWTAYLDREIVEEYKSMLNDDVSIILCNGTERGAYWLISEFKKDHKWMTEGEDEKPREVFDDIQTLTPENFSLPGMISGRREFI